MQTADLIYIYIYIWSIYLEIVIICSKLISYFEKISNVALFGWKYKYGYYIGHPDRIYSQS